MIIVPAIDIRAGRCVRLVQGDYERETVFADDPAAMAERWAREGATHLHLVDLDGARSGRSDNAAAVTAILARLRGLKDKYRVVTELGGGIRDVEAVARWLDLGIDRVILGTVAVTAPDVVQACCQRFPDRVWVGIDARQGRVAVSGWTAGTERDALDLAREVEGRGAGGIIYTDIDRDGTGAGVDAEATVRLARAVACPVYASGGVRSTDDVRRLAAAGSATAAAGQAGGCGATIAGVIVGRALYDGAVSLEDLLDAAVAASAPTC